MELPHETCRFLQSLAALSAGPPADGGRRGVLFLAGF
jgi:hypothetical protein